MEIQSVSVLDHSDDSAFNAELRVIDYGQAAAVYARRQVAEARQTISECMTHVNEASA